MPTTRLRSHTRRMRSAVLGVAAMTMLALSGCGLGTAGGFVPSGNLAGELAGVTGLKGAPISVGSKNFSEQLIVGKMAVILLKSAGANVTDLTNIPGSSSARQAQLAGQVDMEWEYTGTAWISYLGETKPIQDSQQQYTAVRDRDLKENHLVWLPPAPMNNTYGFASPAAKAKELGITNLSGLKKIPVAERTFCVESEFASRDDGFQPMLKAYGLTLGQDVPRQNVRTFDTGAIYAATAQGQCNFGEIFTTDGRIKALNLTVLTDDKKFFPNYNICPVIREDTFQKYPAMADLFNPVSKKLTDDVLLDLNGRVAVNGEDPATVADDWLKSEGFISNSA